jgi:hypothetical protein
MRLLYGCVKRISGAGRFRTSKAEAFVDFAGLGWLLPPYSPEIGFVPVAVEDRLWPPRDRRCLLRCKRTSLLRCRHRAKFRRNFTFPTWSHFQRRVRKKKPRDDAGLYSYLVIAFGGAVDPEGSAVPLFIAVPVVPDVDVAWSGVGSVFTPGTPVAPPWVACAGVGLVFTPGAPVAPPWAPVAPFCCATAKVLDRTKAVASAIVVSFMLVSSWVERKTNRGVALSSSPSSAR